MKTNRKSVAVDYLVFVAPVLLLFSVFFLVPFFMGGLYSLTNWDGVRPNLNFVGFDNYWSLLTDSDYLSIFSFTVGFVLLNVLLTLFSGFLLALVLEQGSRSNRFLRILFFLPNILSPLVAGFVWTFMFNSVLPNVGQIFSWPLQDIRLLADPATAFGALVGASFWQSLGYVMIIYVAGLNTLDKSVLESVMLEGAGAWTRIRFIVLPLIMPAITVNLFWLLSQSFRLFDLNLALTGGGPGKSTTAMALDIYRDGFARNQMGPGSAKAMVLFLLVFVVTLIQLRITKSREVSQ